MAVTTPPHLLFILSTQQYTVLFILPTAAHRALPLLPSSGGLNWTRWFCCYCGAAAVFGVSLLIVEDSWSHSDTHTLGRTYLDEWPAGRRHLYLTTHNTHKRHTSMPSGEFEPTIPASERPQTHALDTRPLGSAAWFSHCIYAPAPAQSAGVVFVSNRNCEFLKSHYWLFFC